MAKDMYIINNFIFCFKYIFKQEEGAKMITEIGLFSLLTYLIYKHVNKDYLKIKKQFDNVIERIPQLKNCENEYIKLTNYTNKKYGYILKVELPIGISSKSFLHKEHEIKEGLNLNSMRLKFNNRLITLYCIKKYNFAKYEPYKLQPNKILVGEFSNDKIIVDMNKFPHVLICGDTGTGKSRLLFTIITNLIYSCKNINLYLLQLRKNDLLIFNKCLQVKNSSKSLEEVLLTLINIDKEIKKREKILDIEKGYLNIQDYNKQSGKYLKYTYIIIEEFSFLNISKGDSKEEKRIKSECIKYIKQIVNVGRSSGVFLITSLQKPTNNSIPTDIKAQLTTRISLKINDSATCQVVMGDNSAVELEERELVCKTKNNVKGYSYTINIKDINKYIEKYKVIKKEKSNNKNKDKNTVKDIMKALEI